MIGSHADHKKVCAQAKRFLGGKGINFEYAAAARPEHCHEGGRHYGQWLRSNSAEPAFLEPVGEQPAGKATRHRPATRGGQHP